jgi:hypothetical protein
VNGSAYTGNIALIHGGVEVLRVAVTIDHADEAGWSGEQCDEHPRAPKQFIPEPHPIGVTLLDDSRRGQTAEAMVAVLHGRVYMVGISPFAVPVAAAR